MNDKGSTLFFQMQVILLIHNMKKLMQSVLLVTSLMPESGKNWFRLMKICIKID